jgi:hypothetical protein
MKLAASAAAKAFNVRRTHPARIAGVARRTKPEPIAYDDGLCR